MTTPGKNCTDLSGSEHQNASKVLGVYVVTYDSTGNFALVIAWGSEDAQDLIDDDPYTIGWGPPSSVRSVQRNTEGPRGPIYFGKCHCRKGFREDKNTEIVSSVEGHARPEGLRDAEPVGTRGLGAGSTDEDTGPQQAEPRAGTQALPHDTPSHERTEGK